MHSFPTDSILDLPDRFTDPFRYSPHPLTLKAADSLLKKLEEWSEMPEESPERIFESHLAEGKMLGVLVVSDCNGRTGYLCGFSGNVAGMSSFPRFVPPIFDLTDPECLFRKGEEELNAINRTILQMDTSPERYSLREELTQAERERDKEISMYKVKMALSKTEREGIRAETEDPSRLAMLIRESQFEKAELKRLKTSWEERIGELRRKFEETERKITELKKERARRSDELQKWIFDSFIVRNASGEQSSVRDIFAEKGLIPPGGTGECAAPKLLNHAFSTGLRPLAMGELWYGKPSGTAVRVHGHFYPSCTSKCGPLLGFMLRGMELEKKQHEADCPFFPIHEDASIILIEKPSGMPSVPGLDGQKSLQEKLAEHYGHEIHAVHRLDMDTSGIMIFAKTSEAATELRKQFEAHTVRKTYKARLSPPDRHRFVEMNHILETGSKGSVSLPLAADYDERPRQKVDLSQGKEALTDYEVTGMHADGSVDVLFHPVTGRTHQLRVHSSHSLGLCRPIAGDLLYGGTSAPRLCLHALSITFSHPVSGEESSFCSDHLCYR